MNGRLRDRGQVIGLHPILFDRGHTQDVRHRNFQWHASTPEEEFTTAFVPKLDTSPVGDIFEVRWPVTTPP